MGAVITELLDRHFPPNASPGSTPALQIHWGTGPHDSPAQAFDYDQLEFPGGSFVGFQGAEELPHSVRKTLDFLGQAIAHNPEDLKICTSLTAGEELELRYWMPREFFERLNICQELSYSRLEQHYFSKQSTCSMAHDLLLFGAGRVASEFMRFKQGRLRVRQDLNDLDEGSHFLQFKAEVPGSTTNHEIEFSTRITPAYYHRKLPSADRGMIEKRRGLTFGQIDLLPNQSWTVPFEVDYLVKAGLRSNNLPEQAQLGVTIDIELPEMHSVFETDQRMQICRAALLEQTFLKFAIELSDGQHEELRKPLRMKELAEESFGPRAISAQERLMAEWIRRFGQPSEVQPVGF